MAYFVFFFINIFARLVDHLMVFVFLHM